MAKRPSKRDLSTGILIVLLAGVLVSQALQAGANHEPADKVSVAGSAIQLTGTVATGAAPLQDVEMKILDTHMRVSSPTDLILSLTSECALWTNTATVGNDDQESIARVEMYIKLDGKVVPVADDDEVLAPTTDPDGRASFGRVVFCNRAVRARTENLGAPGEGDNTTRLYNRTRTANAFNWIAQDVGLSVANGGYDDPANGNNLIDVEVWTRLASEVVCDHGPEDPNAACPAQENFDGIENPSARAAVGKRSLVIEPTKLINDENNDETG
jgi:hypothetical protein